MNVVSFFSGIGGFELAADWMGWKVVSSCEINPFGQQVLKYYWPSAYHHDNVKTVDFEEIKKRIKNGPTIFVAGFPCQPFSAAGKRGGTEDERYGWPDCLRAVKAIHPEWCVLENVRGLTNWNRGMVFDQVQADLETEGYEVLPFLLPACAVGAPHRRDRIWIIAHSNRRGRPEHELQAGRHLLEEGATAAGFTPYTGLQRQERAEQQPVGIDQFCEEWAASDTTDFGIQGSGAIGQQEPKTHAGQGLSLCRGAGTNWNEWPTQSPIRSRNDGLPARLAGITVSKHRTESIKAFGNAIVPHLAVQIYKAIEMYEYQ